MGVTRQLVDRLRYHPLVRRLWWSNYVTRLRDRRYPAVEKGERFVTTKPLRVTALTQWRAPITGGHDVELPEGMIVVADHGCLPGAPGFAAVPEDYAEWELRLIPAADLALRDEPRGYSGYHLVFDRKEIGRGLRRLRRLAENRLAP